jgi:F0F1-type ATP synthase membrane subunit b/b'
MKNIRLPSGFAEVAALVQLIEDKAEIKKVLDSIKKATDAANERIEMVGKVKDIENLNAKARKALNEASAKRAAAEAEAVSIVEAAQNTANKELDAARSAIESAQAGSRKVQQRLLDREKKVAAREAEVQKQMDAAAKLDREAQTLKAKATELQAKAEANMARFKEVMDRVEH